MENKKSSNNLLFFGITGIIGIVGLVGLLLFTSVNTNNTIIEDEEPNIYQDKQIYNLILKTKIEPDYYDKMYRLLTLESNLENDPYNRKLSSKTVKTFSQIAKYHGIKLDTNIDSKTFDFLYKELVKFQLEIYIKSGEINKYNN
jgi:hypothetical protein